MQVALAAEATPLMDVDTLLRQLGRACLALLGAKNLVQGRDRLQFAIGRGALKGANRVVIRLEWDDTYTVEVWRCRGVNMWKLAEREQVYADGLHDVLRALTGFETVL